MKIKNKYPILLLAFLFFTLGITHSNAQKYNTLYWMQGIPQSGLSNPGMKPIPSYYLGMPGLGSFYTGFSHSGFALGDLIRKDGNRFYIDDKNMLSKMRSQNLMYMDLQVHPFMLGFDTSIGHFSVSVAEKMGARLGYPKDLFGLLIKGNEPYRRENEAVSFSGLALDAIHYREYSFGYSREWIDGLYGGARIKIINGLGNVRFAKNDLTLLTDPNSYDLLLQGEFLVNTSLPVEYTINEGNIDEDGDIIHISDDDIDPLNYLFNSQNRGFAIDLGATYTFSPEITFAASIIDLGLINWRTNATNVKANGQFEFTGIDINDFLGDDDFDTDGLLDSIADLFTLESTNNAYRTMLPPKIYLSAAYNLTDMHRFSALNRNEFYAGKLYPSLTLAYTFQPAYYFGTSLSYSVMHGNWKNLGLGFQINLWPLPIQFYTVFDNLYPYAMSFQNFTFHFGLNIVAGYNKTNRRPGPEPLHRFY